MSWDCHAGKEAEVKGLKDTDLKSGVKTVAECEGACNAAEDCELVNWHESDKHCVMYHGKAPTHAAFLKSLASSKTYTACILIKKN